MSSPRRFYALAGAKPSCCPSCQCGSITATETTLPARPGPTGGPQLVTVRAWGCDLCPWVAVEHSPRPDREVCHA